MFNLNGAKEMILKLNKDRTYNVTVKCDDIFENGIINETEMIFPRVEIKNFDIDVLCENDTNTIATLSI
jgi:hypothetical protein